MTSDFADRFLLHRGIAGCKIASAAFCRLLSLKQYRVPSSTIWTPGVTDGFSFSMGFAQDHHFHTCNLESLPQVGLEINPCTLADIGTYTCRLTNPLGSVEAAAQGNVRKVYQPAFFVQKFTDMQQVRILSCVKVERRQSAL